MSALRLADGLDELRRRDVDTEVVDVEAGGDEQRADHLDADGVDVTLHGAGDDLAK